MKKIRKNLYTLQKIVYKDHRLQYIEDENGYLFSEKRYPTKIKPKDLPEWFVYGTYYRCFGYMSAKGVIDLKYVPNLWINHFLQDDFLIVSYNSPIQEAFPDKCGVDKYTGYDRTIYGGTILDFLKVARKHSAFDISEIAKQIQEKADLLPKKHPAEFGNFKFDVQAYLNKE